ncbi:MAG: methyltransferase domain-containing protein [Bacillota bacterium]|nr:methyltransferase domain-containing protein [Bacillota bacterium]MDW7683763.1 methyltransferase domain-containing protein [Bacillota bacterium]
MECKVQQPVYQLHDQEEYQALMDGLEKSKFHKAMILQHIARDAAKIVEVGCGNGVVLDLLSHNFPQSEIIGIDLDPVMCKAAKERKLSNVEILLTDAAAIPLQNETVDTVVYCSTIHEIFSHGGPADVTESLREAIRVLKPGGCIIIRDTLKPSADIVSVSFKKRWVEKRFHKFIGEYKQLKPQYYKQMQCGTVQINQDYLFEYLTKYFYEVGWYKEMEEIYGYFTKEDFCDALTGLGLQVATIHSYLLPYFQKKWSRDLDVDTSFPNSTVIIKAEKV